MVVCFVFLKIYQHNLVIKLSYEKQRLEKKKMQLEKERNDFSVELLSLLDPEKILTKAQEEWGMKAIKINQVRAVPMRTGVDFLRTTSNDDVLKRIGLYDAIIGYTGR